MTTPIANVDNTTLNNLTPNLDIGDVADPALRLVAFQYIYTEMQTIITAYNAFVAAGGIATGNLADLSVTTAKLADLAVTTGKIPDLAIVTAKINDLAVTAAKIAVGTITSAQIADLSIATGDLADALITTAKLADLNVTTAKYADASVTLAKMAAASVGTTQLVDGSVTGAKIAGATITADKFVAGALNNDTQNGLLITALSADILQRSYNVKAAPYNAKGDGITDDGTAINEALADAKANGGGIVFLPSGSYKYTSDLVINGLGVCLVGQGESTILLPHGCNGINIVDASLGYYLAHYGFVRDLQIDGTNAASGDFHGIYAPYLRYSELSNLHIINFSGGGGMTFVTPNPQPTTPSGIFTGYIVIRDPKIRFNKYGFQFTKVDDANASYTISTDLGSISLTSQIHITGNGFCNYNGVGLHIDSSSQFKMDGIDLSANTIVGAFFGKACVSTAIASAFNELGSGDDFVIHKTAEVSLEDTRPYSHVLGDDGIRRDSRGRNNIKSRSKVLSEGSGFVQGYNAVVNGRLTDWNTNQPRYWKIDGNGTSYNLTQTKDANVPNAGAYMTYTPIVSTTGDRFFFPFLVHPYDVGEVLTFSFDYRCSGSPASLADNRMFTYGIYQIASNSVTTAIAGAKVAFNSATYYTEWQRVSFSVIIPTSDRYGGVILFNTNAGQSTVSFDFKNFCVTKGYFASSWIPSRLELASTKHDIYYEQVFYGTMPGSGTFTLTPDENIGSIVSSQIIVSGKVVTTKPSLVWTNRTTVTVTVNDGASADYMIVLRYLPETWTHGGFCNTTSGFKASYFL